jgi:hypothetical protein
MLFVAGNTRKVQKRKVGSFDTIYSEMYHYVSVEEQKDERVPNTAALYRNDSSRKQPFGGKTLGGTSHVSYGLCDLAM